MKRLEGRVVLVTGGFRGIGRAITWNLCREGAKVYYTFAFNAGAAHEMMHELLDSGLLAAYEKLDVRNAKACRRFVEDIVDTEGHLDVLVNNAGITRDDFLFRLSDEDIDAVLDTDLRGAISMMQAVSTPMKNQRSGVIINIASVVGLVGNACQVPYAAAKEGLVGATRSLSRELGRRKVRCIAVAPGFIETDMTAELNDDQRAGVLEQIALKRLGQPGDVADAVIFLASDEASYITGQTLAVDGGMTFV